MQVFLLLFIYAMLLPPASALDAGKKAQLKVLKGMFKAHRRKQGNGDTAELTADQAATEFWKNLPCSHCPALNEMARHVNQIMREINHQKPHANTLVEIEKLEALYYLVEEGGEHPGCQLIDLNSLSEEEINLAAVKRHLIFSKDISLENINAFHLRERRKKIYMYRGKGTDHNKIVMITVPLKGKAIIQYYKVAKNSPPEHAGPLISPEKPKAKKARRLHGYYTKISSGLQTVKDSAGYNLHIGPTVEMDKNNLPKNIILVEASGNVAAAGLTFAGELNLSSKKQSMHGSISRKNKEYLQGKVDNTGDVHLSIPYKFNISKHLFDVSYDTNLNQNTHAMSGVYAKNVSDKSSLSMRTVAKYQPGEGTRGGLWLHYNLKF